MTHKATLYCEKYMSRIRGAYRPKSRNVRARTDWP